MKLKERSPYGYTINIAKYLLDRIPTAYKKVKEQARTLEIRVSRESVTSRLGYAALQEKNIDSLYQQTVKLIQRTLDIEECRILEYLPKQQSFIVLRGSRLHKETSVEKIKIKESFAKEFLENYFYDNNISQNSRKYDNLIDKRSIHSVVNAVIHKENAPFAVVQAYSKKRVGFKKEDSHFLQSIANILSVSIENQRIEGQLRESEKKFRLTISSLTDYGIYMMDTSGNISSWNEAAAKIFGFKASEIIGKSATLFCTAENLKSNQLEKLIEKAQKEGQAATEDWRVRKDGWFFWADININSVRDENGKLEGFVCITRDTTERKRTEETIKFQKTLLEAQSEVAIDGIVVVSTENRIIYYNKLFLSMWGILEDRLNPRLSDNVIKDIKTFANDPDEYLKKVEYLSSHSSEISRDEIELRDGRFFDRYTAPVKDADGTFYGRAWFFRDITEGKQFEKRKDEFVGIASHELKTPLTTLKGYTQILKKRFRNENDPSLIQYLGRMDAQLEKLDNLVVDLLDITKIAAGKLELREREFIYDQLMSDVIKDLQQTTKKHKIIKKGKAGISIYADPERIGQVIINMISNAIKYSPDADKIVINVSLEDNKVLTAIQDFGIGISKRDQKKISEKFFRSSHKQAKTFPGMGLGLYIAAEIIKIYNGSLWLNSTVGKGSTFFFSLPVRSPSPKPKA